MRHVTEAGPKSECGGWDLNPRQAGDIEAELNISRKTPFFPIDITALGLARVGF